MNRVFIFMFCFLLSLPVTGQRTQQRIAVGDDFFEKAQYQQAIGVYKRILRRENQQSVRQELSFKVGESFRRLLNYEEAKKWYVIALNLGYKQPEIYLYLAEVTLGLEEFDLSIGYIEEFLDLKPEDPLGLKLLESAQFAKENYSTETIFEVSNEGLLNNEGQQWGAAFMESVVVMYDDQARVDEQFDIDIRLRYNNIFYWVWMSRTLKERVLFSSTQSFAGDSDGFSNIYQATFNRRKGDWDVPRMLRGEINSNFYDGFLSYNKEEETAYFMNSGGPAGDRATADIYTVQYFPDTDTWGRPTIFPYNTDEYNIGYPSISEDGNTLYFASDNPAGFGGFDIYKIVRDENNQWGDPVNLGSEINTPFNESYPFIAGDVFYFSSYGHPGFGGFDVFYSLIDEEGNYSAPINMGAPVNSSADDFGFIIDEDYTRGFFSSNRPGGKGEDDLYSFRIVPKTFTVRGQVTAEDTDNPIPAMDIFFFDDHNNFFMATTDMQGFFEIPDLSTAVNYYITAYPEGFEELADTLAVRDQLISNRFEVIRDVEKNFLLVSVGEELPAIMQQDPEPSLSEIIEDIVLEEVQTLEIPEPEEEEPVVVAEEPVVVVEEPVVVVEEPVVVVEEPVVVVEEPIADTIIETPAVPEEEVPPTSAFELSSEGFPVIYFEFGKADLTPKAKGQLDTVISFMKANPDKGIIIHAHTDVISSYLFNFYLSQQRARNIMAHLGRSGIDQTMIYPLGHGKTKLAVPDARTDAEHKRNRRATFETIPYEQLQAYLEDASKHSFRYLNSITKEAHFAEGVEYMVQFMASHVPVNPQYYRKIMENLPDVDIIYYYDTDRYHRYLVGSFRDFSDAFAMQRTLRQLGYQIYVVAFLDGERIPVSRARRLTGEL